MKKESLPRLAAWAGVVGPIAFILAFTIEGLLRPGYQPRGMFISELSLGPRGWIQITSFILVGICLLAFAWVVTVWFKGLQASRVGIILLAILGFLYLLSGPFVMDPAGTPTSQASLHGLIHGILGGVVFLLMPIGILSFLKPFKQKEGFQSIWVWTFVLGIFDTLAVLVFTITSKVNVLQPEFQPWQGFIQRLALIPFMFWVISFALELTSKDKGFKSTK
jgi:hypothetical membrane protein